MFYLPFLAVLVVVLFFALKAARSRQGRAPGLLAGRLQRCPAKPNCLCSEYDDTPRHQLAPLDYGELPPEQVWTAFCASVVDIGGRVVVDQHPYLAATFNSALFGFVDDLEARIDQEQGVIHLRAASRQGYSDFGVNKKRVRALRATLQAKLDLIPRSQDFLSM